jgi:hypothetical protein
MHGSAGISTNWCTSDNAMPRPPYARFVLISAWLNISKTAWRFS